MLDQAGLLLDAREEIREWAAGMDHGLAGTWDDERRNEIGVGNITCGTDYPHPEATWPVTRKRTVEAFRGVPDDEIEAMIGGNVAKLHGFDLDELNPLAERIGPERALCQSEAS